MRSKSKPLIAALSAGLVPWAARAQAETDGLSAAVPHLWQDLTPTLLAAMLLPIALLLGLLAHLHARERPQGWLAALMGLWVLQAGLPALPGLTQAQQALLALSLQPWLLLCLVQYLQRLIGAQHRWLNLALPAQGLLLPLSLVMLPERAATLGQGWQAMLIGEALLALLWHGWRKGGGRRGLSPPLLVTSGLALLLSLLLPGLLPLLVPPLLLAQGLSVMLDIAHARQEAERQQLELEQLTQAKVADIERSFSEMAEQKLEQVTERERKRIAADLHDDLGAKLLTIVHTSESDRISTLAREALEEMRLSVRGLTGKPVQLLDALGDWRAEVVSRLSQANILAEWKSPAEDVVHTLPARAYVQTTRILREAVSNIIKHSGATHCIVGCNVQDGDFLVVIQDNGQGISTELDGRLDKGHGMASMKARAKQMHGQCLVESGPGWGTVIRLTIPL